MVEIVIAVCVVLVFSALFSLARAKRNLQKLQRDIAQAWEDVCRAVNARIAALEELLLALRSCGYAPEGEKRLRQAVEELKRSAREPRKLAEADEQVEVVLRGIYRALPKERDERVRCAQNRLAEADEELDLLKSRYNDFVLNWYELMRGFSYRFLMRGKEKPELLALPGEEAELARRHLPTL
ncbi:MAG: hypothetical protein NZ651_01160 [Candidatus Bipolaricaulota bacterium]|nr:hypothetical protein [Candidatus Bipolaricaulota bacterium]MDW8126377.1 hypothetical protein [Candidatus Bipolaricaulota bacterium]